MTQKYKVFGLKIGDEDLVLGSCLRLSASQEFVNSPVKYETVRYASISPGGGPLFDRLEINDHLYASPVQLDYSIPDAPNRGDTSEGAVLVATLLICFPEAEFAFGLPGGIPLQTYLSYGRMLIDLQVGSRTRDRVSCMFDHLMATSYWVDDDVVHILALLTDIAENRNRTVYAEVLGQSTSGNHQIDPGVFHAYQLIEALLEKKDFEPLLEAVARWNQHRKLKLDENEVGFIKDIRDVSLHFRAESAAKKLATRKQALGFDKDPKAKHHFRKFGIQCMIRYMAQEYFETKLQNWAAQK